MNVHVLPAGPIETNAYLLLEPSAGDAVLIDAPDGVWRDVEPLLRGAKCRLSALWITHGHWDHTQGAAEVVRRSGARVYAHAADKALIETPEVMRPLLPQGLSVEPVKVDAWLGDGASLDAMGDKVRVSHVPGHCPGSIMFHFPGSGAAFVGDALFRGSVGRTDLPGGDFNALENSIRTKIYTLPGETTVFSGHGGPTTVKEEQEGNPYVSG